MSKRLKIAFDVLLIAVPLAIVIYFLANPDALNAFLDWMMRTL
jgi:ABC-type phosphate/phosphonate transport system permease subunit